MTERRSGTPYRFHVPKLLLTASGHCAPTKHSQDWYIVWKEEPAVCRPSPDRQYLMPMLCGVPLHSIFTSFMASINPKMCHKPSVSERHGCASSARKSSAYSDRLIRRVGWLGECWVIVSLHQHNHKLEPALGTPDLTPA